MSATLAQIFALNPTSTIGDNDLLYLVQSPYTPGTDAGILGSSLKSLFVLSSAVINTSHGGTGLINPTIHNLLIGNGASPLTLLPPSATSGIPLVSQGAASDPAFSTVVVAGGGTGDTSFTAFSVICGGTTSTSPLQNVSGVGTSGQILTSNGPGVLPTWQPNAASGTVNAGLINQVAFYAAAGTTISGLTTQNNGLLVTSNTGVPSILVGPGATGRILQSNAAAAPSFSTATYPSTGGSAGTILRSDGTNFVNSTATFANTYSASNLLFSNGANTVTGLATANSGVLVTSAGGVPSISSTLPAGLTIPQPLIQGITNAAAPSAGNVGQIITSNVPQASGVAITNSIAANVTTISVTAGNWIIFGNGGIAGSANNLLSAFAWTSLSSATQPDGSVLARINVADGGTAISANLTMTTPFLSVNVNTTTTVYLSVIATFSTGTATGFGTIWALRIT